MDNNTWDIKGHAWVTNGNQRVMLLNPFDHYKISVFYHV